MTPTLQVTDWSNVGAAQDPYLSKALARLSAEWPVTEKRVLEAAEALEAGRPEEAKRALSKFLTKHPRNPDALNLMAEIAQRSRDLKSAELCLAQCVQRA